MYTSADAFYSCLEEVKEIMSKIWLSPDITFDSLMTPRELQKNIDFLQRKDIFLKSVDLKNIMVGQN